MSLLAAQLLAAQNVLNPQVISSNFATCPPQYTRNVARKILSQSVLSIVTATIKNFLVPVVLVSGLKLPSST